MYEYYENIVDRTAEVCMVIKVNKDVDIRRYNDTVQTDSGKSRSNKRKKFSLLNLLEYLEMVNYLLFHNSVTELWKFIEFDWKCCKYHR